MSRSRVLLLSALVAACPATTLAHAPGEDADWRDITRSDALLDRASLEAIAKRSSLDTAERARLALALAHIDALQQEAAGRTQALVQLAGERARLAEALGRDARAGSLLLDIAQDALLHRLAEGTTDAECAVGIPTRSELDLALRVAQESRVFIQRARTIFQDASSSSASASADEAIAVDQSIRAPALDALSAALLHDAAELLRVRLLDEVSVKSEAAPSTKELAQRLSVLEADVGKLPSPLREAVQLAYARATTDAARAEVLARLTRASDPVFQAQSRAIALPPSDLPLASDLTPNALGLCSANASVRARLRAGFAPPRAIEAWKMLLEHAPPQQHEALESAIIARVSKQLALALCAEAQTPFGSAIAGAALARDGDITAAFEALHQVKEDRTAMRIALPILAQLAASKGDAQQSADALFAFAQAFPQDPRALEGVLLALEIAREAALPTLGAQLEALARVLGDSETRMRWLAESTDLALDAGDATLALRRADLLQALGGEARGEAATRKVEARAIDLLARLGANNTAGLSSRAEDLAREASQTAALLPRTSQLHARLAMADAAACAALGKWADAAHRAALAISTTSLPLRVRSAAFGVWLAAVVQRGDAIVIPEGTTELIASHRVLLDDVARTVRTLATEGEQRARAGETDAALRGAKSRGVPLARVLVGEASTATNEISESMRVDAGRVFAAANEVEEALLLLAPLVDANRAGRDGTYAYAQLLLQSPAKHARALECLKALAPLQAEATQRDEIWWLSQCAMLEFLAHDSTDATIDARNDALPRLHRLRALDPDFGSPAAKRRFDALEKSLSKRL